MFQWNLSSNKKLEWNNRPIPILRKQGYRQTDEKTAEFIGFTGRAKGYSKS